MGCVFSQEKDEKKSRVKHSDRRLPPQQQQQQQKQQQPQPLPQPQQQQVRQQANGHQWQPSPAENETNLKYPIESGKLF